MIFAWDAIFRIGADRERMFLQNNTEWVNTYFARWADTGTSRREAVISNLTADAPAASIEVEGRSRTHYNALLDLLMALERADEDTLADAIAAGWEAIEDTRNG